MLPELPINLYAEHYTDLVVEVLNWEKRLQARTFSGMTSSTYGDRQVQFDHLMQDLLQLMKSKDDPGSAVEVP